MLRMPLLNGWSLNRAVTRFRLTARLSVVVQRNPSALRESMLTVVSRELPALVLHAADVVEDAGEPRRARDRTLEQQVVGLLVVVVRRHADPLVGEGHVHADVELLGRSPT